jgi:hypothetical protein
LRKKGCGGVAAREGRVKITELHVFALGQVDPNNLI